MWSSHTPSKWNIRKIHIFFVKKARIALLNDHTRISDEMKIELWTFLLRYVVTEWNNTPKVSLDCKTPEVMFN